MRIRKLCSIVAAAGVMAVALPVVGTDAGAAVAQVGAAAGKCSSLTASDRVDLSQLPAPVKATIQAQRGTDVITRINAETRNGRRVYCVQFKNHADHARPELVVAANGAILSGKRASKTSNGTNVANMAVNR